MHMIEPVINAVAFFDEAPPLASVEQQVVEHLWPCYRFHSRIEDGHWVYEGEPLDRCYHFSERTVADEAAINEFVHGDMQTPLQPNRPRWRITLLRASTPARSALWIRIHHCIGDGIGLLFAFSPLLSCGDGIDPLSTVPLPAALLPKSRRKPQNAAVAPQAAGQRQTRLAGRWCRSLRQFLHGVFGSLTLGHDSELKINAPLADRTPFLPYNGNRAYTRFPPVPMSVVKAVRQRHGCSVNDALLGALVGALRRYAGETRGDPQLQAGAAGRITFQSLLMLGLPRPIDEGDLSTALRNNMLFASCPLPIGEPSAATRLQQVIQACDRLKSAAYMSGLVGFTKAATGLAPSFVMRKAVSEAFSKHSLLVTNVPSMSVPTTFPKKSGSMIKEMQMVFPNVVTQVSMITYNGTVFANIVADPMLFPEPEILGKFWADEFSVLASG